MNVCVEELISYHTRCYRVHTGTRAAFQKRTVDKQTSIFECMQVCAYTNLLQAAYEAQLSALLRLLSIQVSCSGAEHYFSVGSNVSHHLSLSPLIIKIII